MYVCTCLITVYASLLYRDIKASMNLVCKKSDSRIVLRNRDSINIYSRMTVLHLIFLTLMFSHVIANNYKLRRSTIEFFERKLTRQVTVFACWNSYGIRITYSITPQDHLLQSVSKRRIVLFPQIRSSHYSHNSYSKSAYIRLKPNTERVSFYRQAMVSEFKVSYIPIPSDALDMARILTVNYYTLGILLDLKCPMSASVLEEFTRQRLPFNETYQWLLVTNLSAPPISILEDLPLTIDTEMTVVVENGSNYILYDVYNPSYKHGASLNVTPMGNWNLDDGLDLQLTQYKYQRRGNLAGLSINVSLAITHKPTPDFETYVTTPINPHFDTMHRYHYALIRQLRDYYNFTINLRRTDSWGYITNGSYNGMLGDLASGIADIGGTPLTFRKERMDVAEYTVQTYIARASFIFRHPKKSTVRNRFLKPFTDQVWWLTVVMAVLNWVLLWLTARIEIHFGNSSPISTLNTHPTSETALITTAALCQQGLSDGPRLFSGRMVFLSLFLWALLLYQYYSASIVGSLLAEPSRYIRTLKDLTESDLAVGIEDIAYNYYHFATTTDRDSLELHKRKIAPGRGRKRAAYFSAREGLRRMRKGNFAFHVDVATAYKIITDEFTEDEICDLVEIQLFPAYHLGTVTSKHSPFKKMVTYGMRQIIEHGMSERERHVWQHRRPRCPASHSLNPVAVPIQEFAPALFLLLMGSVVAVSVLFAEYYVNWRTLHFHLIAKYETDDRVQKP